jgi:hypothetical protein
VLCVVGHAQGHIFDRIAIVVFPTELAPSLTQNIGWNSGNSY